MIPRIITPPAAEPISIEDCRAHLRVDPEGSPPEHQDDDLILSQLAAAREWAENFTGRALAMQTFEIALDAFPCGAFALPMTPVAAIVSVTYLDENEALQTLSPAAYQIDSYSEPARLLSATGADWPTTSTTAINAVIVRYEAGYSMAGDSPQPTPLLPQSIRAALLLTLGDLYENREDSNDLKLEQIPRGAQALLRPWRLESGVA